MRPGPIRVFRCRACRSLAQRLSWSSGNTFGARFWSDGFVAAPMLAVEQPVYRCPGCKVCVWFAEAEEVGEYDSGIMRGCGELEPQGIPDEWRSAPRAVQLTRAQLLRAAELTRSRDQETTLRMFAWRSANHPVAGHPEQIGALSKRDKASQERLLSLLRERLSWEPVACAELARELGRFDEVEMYLGSTSVTQWSGADQQIRKLAAERDSRVVEIEPD